MPRFFQLAVLVLVSNLWLQPSVAQEVKIGNGRLLKKWRDDVFGSDNQKQTNANKQQPTPADPSQRAGQARTQSVPTNQRQSQAGQTQPHAGQTANQFRQPVSANQRLTPAQQQYQMRIEAQRRAEMLRRQQAGQGQPQGSGQTANSPTQPDYYRNRGTAPAAPASHRTGLSANPQQFAPQPQLQSANTLFQPGPPDSAEDQFQSNSPTQAAQRNATKNAKRRGPPAVGFGMELKTDKQDQIYVADVERQGNAAKVGIKKGDYLVGIGGAKIGTVEEFDEIVKVMSNGDQLELTINRRGKEAVVMITFGEPQEEDAEPLDPVQSGQPVEQPQHHNAELDESFEFVPQNETPKLVPGGPIVNPDAFDIPIPPSQVPSSPTQDRPQLPELELELELPEMPGNDSVLEKDKK